jgi:hypothetical protein
MRLKILGAVVVGLFFVVLAPASQSGAVRGALYDLSARVNPNAQAPASAAATATAAAMNNKPKPTPTPTAAPPAAATDCSIVVPANPLSAQGLATPYQLTQARGNPKCSETNPDVQAFVQAAILDPATGQIWIYNPVVVDRGTKPAVAPTVPTLPANAVVGIWFGYNGGNLTLVGAGARSCVNGIQGSIFGQMAYCNAAAFFQQANALIKAGKITVPDVGTAKDGKPCPTSRDWSVVDQDASDNVTANYLMTAKGQLAQNTPENLQALPGATVQKNGSDEALVAIRLAAALGCTPWKAPDAASPSHQPLTALPLNELQAAAKQPAPQALIPTLDPMVLVDGKRSVSKINAYRVGVDQPKIRQFSDAFTGPYCRNMLNLGLPRIAMDKALTSAQPSPDPAAATNLFTFLAMRFQNTWSADDGFLDCPRLIKIKNPVTLKTDANGVVTDATFAIKTPPAPQVAAAQAAGDAAAAPATEPAAEPAVAAPPAPDEKAVVPPAAKNTQAKQAAATANKTGVQPPAADVPAQ